MTDPNLLPNPKKVVLHHPLVTVDSSVCEELPADSVMLLYLSTAGNSGHCSNSQTENYGIPSKSSLLSTSANNCHEN
ncbi:hypothetical protein C2S52_009231 [Perilla frutescens var. hirtella]|nr:hypothetical protein C2S51_017263 [Perilla frutescens var. frutescens]KAH6784272.1 hypothetical protein C2S52_009231 [Perilla frutescens var. hirtella]